MTPCCNYGEMKREDKKAGKQTKGESHGENEQYQRSKVTMRSKTRQNKSEDTWNLVFGFELDPG